jgi:hypothetical protein
VKVTDQKSLNLQIMISIKPQIAKVAKAREFTYVPRYYDERKEKIAEMEKQIRESENDKIKGEHKVKEFRFRRSMNMRWRGEEYEGAVKKSNKIIFLLMIALFFIGYYIVKHSDAIQSIMDNNQ